MSAYRNGVDEGLRFGRELTDHHLQNAIEMEREGLQDEYQKGLVFGLEAEMGRRQAILQVWEAGAR